ncbi:MAG: DegV family protein [Dehalococcoidales bacterium]|nr:DegV family protein [Dehalococcoidales bacterium]
MPVKIVTDSTSDLSPELARENDISVVPLYVRFGEHNYRDGVDISLDEFYTRLTTSNIHPSTSQPSPADFARTYNNLAKETDQIISIHLSKKLSGTYNAALQGKEFANTKAEITVIDSESVSMGLGMTTLMAARLAKAGANIQKITGEVKEAIRHTHLMGTFDTLKYLVIGGRIGKAKALVGSVLNVKPVLIMREGELHPVANVRTHNKGVEKLVDFVKEALHIQELTVIHTTTPDEADSLKNRLAALVDTSFLHVARLGPAVGVYGGPGMMAVAFRTPAGDIEPEPKDEKSLIDRIPKISVPSIHMTKIHLPHR